MVENITNYELASYNDDFTRIGLKIQTAIDPGVALPTGDAENI